ncbi:hypothetical protein A2572_00020 [Candidatus Collierbacteria bacterium RIFOXYD1_FULL_40_9]|uniref:Uncharacterized protein n=1 Tax=Candidatus Collierbacteria bacterium RIFOXYD1_FULL_40_9 TaxID=1817731 RepID=A0A1F5FWE1_9BACT|nr:MAG: hypothetical protein A2572_00020 [Candidatus Collierbacteria bacterium RIFOXYD1_FULL_40_9]
MADFIEGGAMGHTEAQLRELHDFAHKEKERQAAEIENERLRQVADVERRKQEHQENMQFLSSFLEKIRQVHDNGHESCIALPNGENLKIIKSPGSVTIAIVPDNTTPLYTTKNQFSDKLKFLTCFIRRPGGQEDLYVWDKPSLIESNQNPERSTYSYANLHFSDLESKNSVDTTADLKIQQLKSLLPFDLEDLDQSLATQS